MFKFLKKIKFYLEGKILLSPTIKINKKWIGNRYGGFYVSLENINKKSIIYSIGIGEDISFDNELIDLFDCTIYGFDPTPKSVEFVRKNKIKNNFKFSDVGISNKTERLPFYLPKNNNYVSGSLKKIKTVSNDNQIELEFKRLKDVMDELSHNHVSLLKMDIEGAEYDVIEDIIKEKLNIKQIIVEFHPQLINNGKSKTKTAIISLLNAGYELFGISDNYCEYSFIKTA